MTASEIEQMASLLENLGIGHTYAAKYAKQLFDEGYDTPDSLVHVSEKAMQELDFKEPHIRMIKQSSRKNLQRPQSGEEASKTVGGQLREAQRKPSASSPLAEVHHKNETVKDIPQDNQPGAVDAISFYKQVKEVTDDLMHTVQTP